MSNDGLRGTLAGIGRRAACAVAVVAALLATGGRAFAQQGPGVQVGVSAQPDQFYVGANYLTAPIVDQIRFRPNLEVGVGDSATLLAGNFEFVYPVALPRTPWHLYVGGGPALDILRRNGNTSSGGGFNVVLGLAHRRGLFTEIKVGLLDSPSFKFGIGYTFNR
ncbi:MAG TPA: hypothetical protein VNE16_10035 [Vicinamibacterales bacterium]|nr:hypothetical protein [Vicinamibacterales bacterium]